MQRYYSKAVVDIDFLVMLTTRSFYKELRSWVDIESLLNLSHFDYLEFLKSFLKVS